jgi:hypothetical protein
LSAFTRAEFKKPKEQTRNSVLDKFVTKKSHFEKNPDELDKYRERLANIFLRQLYMTFPLFSFSVSQRRLIFSPERILAIKKKSEQDSKPLTFEIKNVCFLLSFFTLSFLLALADFVE